MAVAKETTYEHFSFLSAISESMVLITDSPHSIWDFFLGSDSNVGHIFDRDKWNRWIALKKRAMWFKFKNCTILDVWCHLQSSQFPITGNKVKCLVDIPGPSLLAVALQNSSLFYWLHTWLPCCLDNVRWKFIWLYYLRI